MGHAHTSRLAGGLRRIAPPVALLAAGLLSVACGGASYSSDESNLVRVTGVTITCSPVLLVGNTQQLAAELIPANATDRRVSWSSSQPSVATITAAGVVAGQKEGTAKITVTTVDGQWTASCELTVAAAGNVGAKDVTIDPPTASLTIGASVTLVATVLPLEASNKNVAWQASNGNVALAPAGAAVKVTGIAMGTATITATTEDGGHVRTAEVTVGPERVTDVILSSTTLSLTEGLSAPLTAIISPANATDQTVTWASSDSGVAAVTTTAAATTATVLAVRAGTASISVTTTDGRKSALCDVTVKAANVATVKVDGIALNRPPEAVLNLEVGSTGAVVATVTPDAATNKEVNWSASTPAVTLSATTGSEVTVTGAKPGTATITAVTVDGARAATTGVKVWLLDAEIAASTAAALTAGAASADAVRRYGTRSAEQAVGKLLYRGAENAFSPGERGDVGILLNNYASGSRSYAAAVGDSVGLAGTNSLVQVNAYVGVPASRVANAASPSVKVAVTAKPMMVTAAGAKSRVGSPRVALWSQGRVVGVSDVLPADGLPHTYTFDAVPASGQINVFDGGPEGSSMYVQAIRIEPSATPLPDYTPPHEVESLTATALSTTAVTLSWNNPGTDADLAEVRITYGSPPVTAVVPAVAGTAGSFTASDLLAGRAYTFRVRAVDRAGYASDGVTYVRNGADPLLDEQLPIDDATIADINYLVTTSQKTVVSVPSGKLGYYGRKPTFGSSANHFWWVESSVDAKVAANKNTVGSVVDPKGLVVIPAAYTALPSADYASIRLVVKASQAWLNPVTIDPAAAPLGLVLVRGVLATGGTWTPFKGTVIANVPVPDGSPGGTPSTTFVFDGLPPNTQYAIGCDFKQMFLDSVRVEPSASPPGAAPVVTVP